MNSRSTPSRLLRGALLSLLALVLTLGGPAAATLVPGLTPGAQAAETQIDQGTVTWGIKESWRTYICLLYTSPSPRDGLLSRMPSSA